MGHNTVPMPDVSILIVGFNSLQYLGKCLGSISAACSGCSHEILFVNNGSDGSEEWIRQHFPQTDVLPTKGNVGFGAANNYLARQAQGKWLLLLNPDTILEPKAIANLLKAGLHHSEFGILGGLSMNAAREPLVLSRLAFPTLGRILLGLIGRGGAILPQSSSDAALAVDAVSGAFMAIRRDAWQKLAGFDERFFLYAEELDLCRRWHTMGGKVALVPSAKVIHDVGSGDPSSPERILLSMRGAATFYRKHYSLPEREACLAAHWLSCAIRFAFAALATPFQPARADLRRSMRDVTLKPWIWWGGYPELA